MNPDRKFLGINVDRRVADWLATSDNVSEKVRTILRRVMLEETRRNELHMRYQSALMDDSTWTPTLRREMVDKHDVKELAVKMNGIVQDTNFKSDRLRMLRYELRSFIREANRDD